MERKNKEIKVVSIIGIFFNFILLILKLIVGFFSHSQAMIADGLNSAGDIFASMMSFIGNKISSKPHDKDHPYGHGKAEYIFSQLIGISMLIAAISMLNSSLRSIVMGDNVEFSYFLIVVSVLTIIIKAALFLYTRSKYKTNKSILIKASMEDHRNDMVVTVGTILGIVASAFGYSIIDGMVGACTSLWIGIVGIRLFKTSYDVLMDKTMEDEEQREIMAAILEIKEVIHLDHISTKPVGDSYIVIVKIALDGNMTLNDSHKIGGRLKEKLVQQFGNIYDVIVHTNPY